MFKIYGDIRSGNCYKVKLLMHLLDIEHEWIHVDILKKETHTEEFLAINPNAKIPALVMSRGDCLWESNAILNYLADGTHYLPSKKFVRSQVLQWQFFEQYSHEPYVAVARYLKVYLGLPKNRKAEHKRKLKGGYKALDVMEEHLKHNKYFVANLYSIADISLYAYTHVAEQGGFNLSKYPAIVDWLSRIESRLKHQTIQDFITAEERVKKAEKRLKLKQEQEAEEKKAEEQEKDEQDTDAAESDQKDSNEKNSDKKDKKTKSLKNKATDQATEQKPKKLPSIYPIVVSDIDGKELSLAEYYGEVVLIVNVASECGLTPQYSGLQALFDKYRDDGFTVLGLPCNQFGAQEPGGEEDIKDFCTLEYSVDFPMTSKIEVNGVRRHPLYDALVGEDAKFPGDITWNFEKFLIGRNGRVIKRYAPDVEPHAAELVRDIDKALKS